MIHSLADERYIVLELIGEGELIEEMIQGFLFFFANRASQGSNETLLDEIVPSEDAPM